MAKRDLYPSKWLGDDGVFGMVRLKIEYIIMACADGVDLEVEGMGGCFMCKWL